MFASLSAESLDAARVLAYALVKEYARPYETLRELAAVRDFLPRALTVIAIEKASKDVDSRCIAISMYKRARVSISTAEVLEPEIMPMVISQEQVDKDEEAAFRMARKVRRGMIAQRFVLWLLFSRLGSI
jgi:hypothetical protein